MRLSCPLCGPRDRREFYYYGSDDYLNRPHSDPQADASSGGWSDAWEDYLHLRDNPAGRLRDLWYHEGGCGAWLAVTRDTSTHQVFDVALVVDLKGKAGS
ncbi:MAG: sarcosine oxidase subunit delta [Paracoccaceae bacterium]|jgi:heterotetrameric sarcosine oxidase delta subunit|nr:sarcosine oxidase subunit delta [Paracoccaceae bacterium]MDP5346047.1 sarcosine oxidase subunit delta [Paracoccaceae bacterium]